jgi:hypothetical protein
MGALAMADEKETTKSLEMRVAELEDKMRSVHITEDEMKAYNKVASLMGGGGAAAAAAAPALPSTAVLQCISHCVVNQCTIRACTINPCTIVQQCIRHCTIVQPCTVQQCIIQQCINECGGGLPGAGGGGFGTLGG